MTDTTGLPAPANPDPGMLDVPPGPVAVRRASPEEAAALAGVLARAFVRDPMVTWPMVTDADLVPRLRSQFLAVDSRYAAEGWLYRAGDGLGAMALLPPDSDARQAVIDAVAAMEIAGLSPDGGERYGRMWSWIAGLHPPERHWLLDQLAVEPAAHGRGIGGAMLRFAIEAAEADGVPLLLETGVAGNVGLYERFGFRVAWEADAPDGGPHIWFMQRDPHR